MITGLTITPALRARSSHPVPTRFGFGGEDEQKRLRPLPQPEQYRVAIGKKDIRVSRQGKIQINSRFVDELYRRVFRSDLAEPGFVLVSGLGPVLGDDMKKIREFQVELGLQLSKRRSKALGIEKTAPFSLKYLGRSNKAKKNPIHCDTKSTDSIVLMLYEPAKNIKAFPFFADLTQYAKDKGLDPLQLITQDNPFKSEKNNGYKVKSHYGHQIKVEHQPALLDQYTVDLEDLDLNAVQLVVFNDSTGIENCGLAHGMRKMEIPDPNQPAERYFNHVVFDVQNREVCRPIEYWVPAKQKPTYFEKGIDEALQQPVSFQEAIKHYIDTGKIYYRNPRFTKPDN